VIPCFALNALGVRSLKISSLIALCSVAKGPTFAHDAVVVRTGYGEAIRSITIFICQDVERRGDTKGASADTPPSGPWHDVMHASRLALARCRRTAT
jgi:hypothetical protein